jgi:hypothetical protein
MMGVAHAQCLKLMASDAAKLAAAKQNVRKKQKEGHMVDFDVEVQKQLDAWDYTSFSSIPRDVRWKVIKSLRRNYKKMVVEKSKSDLKKHDDAGVARQVDNKAAAETTAMNRSLNWHKTAEYNPVATAADLRQLTRDNTPEDLLEALRDALRARRHCYGQTKRADLPNIFCDKNKDKDKELETRNDEMRCRGSQQRSKNSSKTHSQKNLKHRLHISQEKMKLLPQS